MRPSKALLLAPADPCALCHVSPRLQEVNSMINKRLKDVLFTDQWSEVCMERLSPFGYVLVSNGFWLGTCARWLKNALQLPFLCIMWAMMRSVLIAFFFHVAAAAAASSNFVPGATNRVMIYNKRAMLACPLSPSLYQGSLGTVKLSLSHGLSVCLFSPFGCSILQLNCCLRNFFKSLRRWFILLKYCMKWCLVVQHKTNDFFQKCLLWLANIQDMSK